MSYTYDSGAFALGRLTSVAFAGGQIDYSYDAAGRPKGETWMLAGLQVPLGFAFGYHLGGQLKTIEYPPQVPGTTGSVLEVDLGSDEQVSEIRFGGVTRARSIQHYPFDGRVESFTRGNGPQTKFGYDILGRRTSVLGGPVDLTYDIDSVGNVEKVRAPFGTGQLVKDYSYDAVNRLTGAASGVYPRPATEPPFFTESYDYDLAGNRTRKVRNGKQYLSVFDYLIPFAPAPKLCLPPFRMPYSTQPFTTPLSSLAYLLGGRASSLGSFLRGAGRFGSRFFVPVVATWSGVKTAACFQECAREKSVMDVE